MIALTDHDTTRGWAPAIDALPAGLTLVPGAELSCEYEGISLHLLAYLFDPDEPTLAAARVRVRDSRLERARRIVELLRADGWDVSWDEVLADAAGATVGRPHVARALVRHGLATSVDDAFGARWLGNRGRYWVPKIELDALTAVRLVRAAGGVPVFAHPFAAKRGRTVGDDAIVALAEAGLAGLEVDHPDQTPAERRHLRTLAADLGLLTTGSSDYHGTNKVTGIAVELTQPEVYEALVAQGSGAKPVTG